jgi:hypothetical protein
MFGLNYVEIEKWFVNRSVLKALELLFAGNVLLGQ